MVKFKTKLKWYNFTAVIVILCVTVAFANIKSTDVDNSRPDIINIDFIKVFGDLERHSVIFPHDKHTDAVEKSGGNCQTCHDLKGDKLSQEFIGSDDKNRKAVMDNFHINCIGCHEKTKGDNIQSGPVACADCHQEKPLTVSSRQPMGLDNSLHYRHSKAYDNKCEACHTDCKTDKYSKGKETTCRHCHSSDKSDSEMILIEQAAHESCISCHMAQQAEKKETGPVKCAGCHDSDAQKSIKKVIPVPRMERNQPDILMLKTGSSELDKPGANRMDFVSFNHKGHENYNDTCRVCHHKSMSACNTCHTVDGSEESMGVSLEQAMHKLDSQQSCTGCHELLKHDTSCAGCHGFLAKNRKQDDASCLMCHEKQPDGKIISDAELKKMIGKRPNKVLMYNAEDIPENIIIKELSEKYEPVNFPHRQIVNKIAENIKENKLAAYFHSDKGTLCQGCHHNSPATKKPTGCKNCHGKPFSEKNSDKPGIMGAYHIQCMECHVNMHIEQVGCTDCHSEKSK